MEPRLVPEPVSLFPSLLLLEVYQGWMIAGVVGWPASPVREDMGWLRTQFFSWELSCRGGIQ